jgi:hypothetical protein
MMPGQSESGSCPECRCRQATTSAPTARSANQSAMLPSLPVMTTATTTTTTQIAATSTAIRKIKRSTCEASHSHLSLVLTAQMR